MSEGFTMNGCKDPRTRMLKLLDRMKVLEREKKRIDDQIFVMRSEIRALWDQGHSIPEMPQYDLLNVRDFFDLL